MSLCSLPILFFNLGGEMLYILDQRLRAQKVSKAKSEKVMRDIVGQMLDSRCVKEIFRPQKVLTRKSLRLVFERLAHASIMKLNSSAMDKLYDLMVMATKYQLLLCRRGEDVILVSFNHLDTIRELVGDSESHVAMVDYACKIMADFYCRFTPAQFVQLRYTLLSIFQDTHKRVQYTMVSIFLKTGAQLPNGRFSIPAGGPVPNGFEIPGAIKYFDAMGVNVKMEERFSPPHPYSVAESPGTWDVRGNRGITLGLNVYTTDKSVVETPKVLQSETSEEPPVEEEKEKSAGPSDAVVNAELHLLERLLGRISRQAPSDDGDTFHLRLFSGSDDEEEEKLSKKSGFGSDINVVEIKPSKKGTSELDKIMKDFTLQGPGEGSAESDDLLDLMDTLS